MVQLTAWSLCPVDGAFPVDMPLFAGSMTNVRIENSSAMCPRCGRMVPMVDGRYDVAPTGSTTLTATSQDSAEMIEELSKQLLYMQRVAADRRLSDAEAAVKLDAMAERAARQHPEYAPILREKVIGQPRKKARKALRNIGIGLTIIATADGVAGAVERTGDAISGIVEQIERGEDPTLPPDDAAVSPQPAPGPDPAQLPTTAPPASAAPEPPSSQTPLREEPTPPGRPHRR